MRRSLPIAVLLVLALAGCSTSQQKENHQTAKVEKKMKDENTRTTEHLRMEAVETGEVNSQRGASILYPDYGRSFDPNKNTSAAMRNYGTKSASTKNYDSDKNFRVDKYGTHDFYGSKADAAADKKYAAKDASTKGKFIIPNAGKAVDTKTAATKQSSDANKEAPTRELAQAHRPYLGKESQKVHQSVDSKDLANWHNGEAVTYSDGVIDKVSTLKPLSIEDIRDLLNKSK